MTCSRSCLRLWLFLAFALTAVAQQQPVTVPDQSQSDEPVANPGRPTVANPATLTPVGYFQFETGILAAWQTPPQFSSQVSFNEAIRFSVSRWIELIAADGPFANSFEGLPANASGDLALGVQAIVHHGQGTNPTIALNYLGRIYDGPAPDLDIGGYRNSGLVLVSADVKGFHYDANVLFNDLALDGSYRVQYGQALAISHPLGEKFGVAGEIWHFTQPFMNSDTVGTLWAVNYNARKNLVLDCGFDRGLTSTSTRWELFAGFTYLLPHKVARQPSQALPVSPGP